MDYYYFDPYDPVHGLDKPMISPHLIPEYKMQHWDKTIGRYVLISKRGGSWGKRNQPSEDVLA